MIKAVTPQGRWSQWKSSALRGSPATHAIKRGEILTLCKRDPTGWAWHWDESDPWSIVNCKQCLATRPERAEESDG